MVEFPEKTHRLGRPSLERNDASFLDLRGPRGLARSLISSQRERAGGLHAPGMTGLFFASCSVLANAATDNSNCLRESLLSLCNPRGCGESSSSSRRFDNSFRERCCYLRLALDTMSEREEISRVYPYFLHALTFPSILSRLANPRCIFLTPVPSWFHYSIRVTVLSSP